MRSIIAIIKLNRIQKKRNGVPSKAIYSFPQNKTQNDTKLTRTINAICCHKNEYLKELIFNQLNLLKSYKTEYLLKAVSKITPEIIITSQSKVKKIKIVLLPKTGNYTTKKCRDYFH